MIVSMHKYGMVIINWNAQILVVHTFFLESIFPPKMVENFFHQKRWKIFSHKNCWKLFSGGKCFPQSRWILSKSVSHLAIFLRKWIFGQNVRFATVCMTLLERPPFYEFPFMRNLFLMKLSWDAEKGTKIALFQKMLACKKWTFHNVTVCPNKFWKRKLVKF